MADPKKDVVTVSVTGGAFNDPQIPQDSIGLDISRKRADGTTASFNLTIHFPSEMPPIERKELLSDLLRNPEKLIGNPLVEIGGHNNHALTRDEKARPLDTVIRDVLPNGGIQLKKTEVDNLMKLGHTADDRRRKWVENLEAFSDKKLLTVDNAPPRPPDPIVALVRQEKIFERDMGEQRAREKR